MPESASTVVPNKGATAVKGNQKRVAAEEAAEVAEVEAVAAEAAMATT